MKTDSIFYRLFQERSSCFFELIGCSEEVARSYRFESFELKQTAFRIDGFFLPIAEESNQPLYFVEVQFRYDVKVYSGLFAEIFVYLHQNDPLQDWRAVVIYATRGFEPRTTTPYEDLLNSPRVMRVYLNELPPERFNSLNLKMIEFLVADPEVAVEKGKRLLAQARQEVTGEEQVDTIELIETLLVYKFSQLSREEIVTMFALEEFKQSRLYQEIYQEGREEGREETKLEVILNLHKLGLSVDQIAQAVNWEVEKVRQVIQENEG